MNNDIVYKLDIYHNNECNLIYFTININWFAQLKIYINHNNLHNDHDWLVDESSLCLNSSISI